MPTIPKYEQQVATKALPGVRHNQASSGAQIGMALDQVANTATNIELDQLVQENESLAKDMDLQFNGELRELLHNPDTGYFSQKGKNAYEGRKAVETQIDGLKQKYIGMAGRGAVRRAFSDVANRRIEASKNSISTHASNQFSAWQQEMSETRANQSMDDAILNRHDAEKRLMHIHTGRKEITDAFERKGMGGEIAQEKAEAFESTVHAGIIDQLILEDHQEAKKYFRDQEKNITPAARVKIKQEFRRIDKQKKAEAKAYLVEVKDAVKDAVYALDRGYVPPNIESVKKMAAGTKFAEKLRDASARVKQSREFVALPPSTRETLLAQLRAGKVKDVDDVKALERLEKTNTAINKLLDEDPIAYGVEIGLGKSPDPLNTSDPVSFVSGLKHRKALALAVEEHSGRPVSPLSVADKHVFEQVLEYGSTSQKIQFFGRVTEALGKDAALMAFEDMDGKQGGQYGLAGQLMAHGVPVGAQSILDGMDQRKANPKLIPSDTDLLPSLQPLYGLWSNQPEKAGQYIEGVKNAYASLAQKQGVIDGQIDQDLLDVAVESVTGGVVEMDAPGVFTGDFYMLAPKPGMTTDDVQDWLERINIDQIESAGGVFGLPPERVVKFIKDGDVVLETLTRGRYLVQWDGRYLMESSGDSPFILEYTE